MKPEVTSPHWKRVSIFCGSHLGRSPEILEQSLSLIDLLAEKKIGIVYGGASVGLMGKIADRMLERGGEVIGVIPKLLVEREVAHKGLSDLRIVSSMHERKALMADLSDAFIALPGGFGTFDELCEMVTWAQIGYHHKPVGILNCASYFDPFLKMLDHAVTEGFIRPERRASLKVGKLPRELIVKMQ